MLNQAILLEILFLLSLICQLTLAWSPTDSYAPGPISCPAGKSQLTRKANSLSSSEKDWVAKRHAKTKENLLKFLESKTNISSIDYEKLTKTKDINIGLAFSGGGYRAMLSGAGMLSALDNRTKGAFEHGLGGLLESSTYIAGLSGGNWLTGTLAMNNWTSVQDIIDHKNDLWDLQHSIFNPAGTKHILETVEIFSNISSEVDDKKHAGFNISMTDIWARALSRDFFPHQINYGAALTWSGLRSASVFANAEMPFPISVSDGRYPDTKIVTLNSTNFEFNPYEMGSWDPTLNTFVDVKYIGTHLKNGKPVGTNSSSSSKEKCVAGYDNVGFVMGTSSSLFNQFLLQINNSKYKISDNIKKVAVKVLNKLSNEKNDISVVKPNPFYKTTNFQNGNGSSGAIAKDDTLYLVDGGEDGQNVPLSPLIQPKRDLDVVIAFDNSADTKSFPNGESLINTYERQFGPVGIPGSFPYVPDTNTFLANNLTAKPTFFGCDAKNLTSLNNANSNSSVAPLVVYIANRPFTFWSNTSTFKMSYTEKEKTGMISNGFEVASRKNLTLDREWPTCLGCALIRRAEERNNIEQSDACKKCFQEYCWDGKISTGSTTPSTYTLDGMATVNASGNSTKTSSTGAAGFTAEGLDKGKTSNIFGKIVNHFIPHGN